MKQTFAASAVAALVYATPQGAAAHRPMKMAGDPKFINFAAKQNKHYTTPEEVHKRESIFNGVNEKIQEWNAKSKASGKKDAATFGHNVFSDFTQEELEQVKGFKEEDPSKRRSFPKENRGNKGRGLVATATTIDHAASGKMHAVKNQGQCGSCWAFAANTALEGAIAIKNNTSPVRLSEQQLVDCTLTGNSYN